MTPETFLQPTCGVWPGKVPGLGLLTGSSTKEITPKDLGFICRLRTECALARKKNRTQWDKWERVFTYNFNFSQLISVTTV